MGQLKESVNTSLRSKHAISQLEILKCIFVEYEAVFAEIIVTIEKLKEELSNKSSEVQRLNNLIVDMMLALEEKDDTIEQLENEIDLIQNDVL